MFSGIIQAIGCVKEIHIIADNARFNFTVGDLDIAQTQLGDSIAVNGVCLTVIAKTDAEFLVDVSPETMGLTQLGLLKAGELVNLEKALTLHQGINGHLVSGHVDGLANIKSIEPLGEHTLINMQAPKSLLPFIAKKGSICINGVSLTINTVEQDIFSLNIVPHTLKSTTFGQLKQGDQVNIEVDLLARHLEVLLKARGL